MKPQLVWKVESISGRQRFQTFRYRSGPVYWQWNDHTNICEHSTDPDNVLLRTETTITYDNCPIFWRSTLQTEIALSTAEAMYSELSTALRQVIPLMTMMEEIHAVFTIQISKPEFVCKVHEDGVTTPVGLESAKAFLLRLGILPCTPVGSFFTQLK